jgi:hypothetical protein
VPTVAEIFALRGEVVHSDPALGREEGSFAPEADARLTPTNPSHARKLVLSVISVHGLIAVQRLDRLQCWSAAILARITVDRGEELPLVGHALERM